MGNKTRITRKRREDFKEIRTWKHMNKLELNNSENTRARKADNTAARKKILATESRFKIYRKKIQQCKQNEIFYKPNKNSTSKFSKLNNRMQMKQNNKQL